MNAVATFNKHGVQYDARFYTRSGRLTRYALACGYVEQHVDCSGKCVMYVTLYMRDGVLFVRSHDEVIYAGRVMSSARATYDAEVRAFNRVIR
jgi:hypothetical protein